MLVRSQPSQGSVDDILVGTDSWSRNLRHQRGSTAGWLPAKRYTSSGCRTGRLVEETFWHSSGLNVRLTRCVLAANGLYGEMPTGWRICRTSRLQVSLQEDREGSSLSIEHCLPSVHSMPSPRTRSSQPWHERIASFNLHVRGFLDLGGTAGAGELHDDGSLESKGAVEQQIYGSSRHTGVGVGRNRQYGVF